jgi:hypothetical protein
MSLFEIKCPGCKATLWIDPSTGALVDHKAANHQKADLGAFIKSQKNRGNELEDKFKKAKEEQLKRKEELEKQFKKAQEHPEEFAGKGDDMQDPFKWD